MIQPLPLQTSGLSYSTRFRLSFRAMLPTITLSAAPSDWNGAGEPENRPDPETIANFQRFSGA